MRGKSKFNILEDGIMSPIIASLVQSVVTEYVVNRARGSVAERTRCRLLVAPQLEHVCLTELIKELSTNDITFGPGP